MEMPVRSTGAKGPGLHRWPHGVAGKGRERPSGTGTNIDIVPGARRRFAPPAPPAKSFRRFAAGEFERLGDIWRQPTDYRCARHDVDLCRRALLIAVAASGARTGV